MIDNALRNLHVLRGRVMPPFLGTKGEREALARWLAEIAKGEANERSESDG